MPLLLSLTSSTRYLGLLPTVYAGMFGSCSTLFIHSKLMFMRKLLHLFLYGSIALTTFTALPSCQKETLAPDDEQLSRSRRKGSGGEEDCKKERRAYRDTFATAFGFVPDIANGWEAPNPAPAWYPGSGQGMATHIGGAKTYFNQYATFGPGGLISLPAPVTMFFGTELGALSVPSSVTSVVMDHKGNAIWFQSNGSTTTPVSPTRINFTGTATIVGGNGKFRGATGAVTLNGYFNPTNPNDAASGQRGWISY